MKGLEPSTCAMATRRSSQLSYIRFFLRQFNKGRNGADEGTRTLDLRDGNAPL